MDLRPYQVTLRHSTLSGTGKHMQTERISAIDPREAIYECLEHHPEAAKWQTLDVQVRRATSLADSATAT